MTSVTAPSGLLRVDTSFLVLPVNHPHITAFMFLLMWVGLIR